jgi:hypothetical protein
MEQSHNGINNSKNPDRKKTAIESKIYWRFITTVALPTVLVTLTLIAAAPISPVQATLDYGGSSSNETTATPAPGGASLGPPANETNVTSTAAAQSACLSQNATTTGRPAVDTGAATSTNNTTTTVAPGGASIGANETSISPAPAGNTTTTGRPAVDTGAATSTNNTTTATIAPSGASVC